MRHTHDDRCINGCCPYCETIPTALAPALPWPMRNIGKDHWLYCDEHRTKWRLGSNIYSSWQHESEEHWRENARHMAGYSWIDRNYVPYLDRVFAWETLALAHFGLTENDVPDLSF